MASKFDLCAGAMPVELGQLVKLKYLWLEENRLTGAIVCPSIHVLHFLLTFSLFPTGELPKELGNLINLKGLWLFNNRFQGTLYVPCYIIQRTWFHMHVIACAGPLPTLLPVSLEVLNFGVSYDNTNKFTGGIPSEWCALTNLKELVMVACGLDGKPLS